MTGAVIVTTPQEIAVIDARKGLKMFDKVGIPIVGIVENMSTRVLQLRHTGRFRWGGGRAMCRDYNVPFLGGLPLDSKIRAVRRWTPDRGADPDGAVAVTQNRPEGGRVCGAEEWGPHGQVPDHQRSSADARSGGRVALRLRRDRPGRRQWFAVRCHDTKAISQHVAGAPVLGHTLRALAAVAAIEHLFVVVPATDDRADDIAANVRDTTVLRCAGRNGRIPSVTR